MKTRIVILAAGKGKRLNLGVPKPLVPVGGIPILKRQLDAVRATGLDPQPVIVVGHEREQICAAVGDSGPCSYAVQEMQLGTGHALACAREAAGDADRILVFMGDHPFMQAEILLRLAHHHTEMQAAVTIMTVTVPSFDDWYQVFNHWGRVLRDVEGRIIGIREYKDATPAEREIREIHPSYYCFDGPWLWANIEKIGTNNANREYYLTDTLGLAYQQGQQTASLPVEPEFAIGINTPEELSLAESLCQNNTLPSLSGGS